MPNARYCLCRSYLVAVHFGQDGVAEELVLGKLELELITRCADGEKRYADILLLTKTFEASEPRLSVREER